MGLVYVISDPTVLTGNFQMVICKLILLLCMAEATLQENSDGLY